ncbi:3-methyladenine DNA glycosylase [uncultured Corynebacterium sp.]|uniref:3-methyladenine DNA glycosylase n=1 Tax=uncultured Corynebacterium sp. TaxID=159447 RepID=UPI0025E3E8C5|nr:3-methyladenine DNA glycosylase [uncultured Corynebacterium sp.]
MTADLGAQSPLPLDEWLPRAEAHARRADDLCADHLDRRSRGIAHPVWDFLFEYYPVRPGMLRRWSPGAGLPLAGADDPRAAEHVAHLKHYRVDDDGVARLDVAALRDRRGGSFGYVADLLSATMGNEARFDCFGLHEWAMVYRADDTRHPVPLRLGRAGTDEVVDGHRVRCTHYDAFRFFTPDARPLNEGRPTRETQPACEQGGCLHANMDLYKWATKLSPVVPGELVLDAFELARDVRRLDMEASPYDLRDHGFAPVRIETPEGKAAYVARQRELAERARPMRAALVRLARPFAG